MTGMPTATPEERDTRGAILLGLKGRCPSCGHAPLFARYLKPVAACPACGQDWTAQRADDLPAYLVILILGHLIVPLVVEVNRWFDPSTLFQMIFWPAITTVLALLMLQPVKGAVIALQWAKRMHGFGGSGDA
jgi:uncharacterized protein (DUF983 family)